MHAWSLRSFVTARVEGMDGGEKKQSQVKEQGGQHNNQTLQFVVTLFLKCENGHAFSFLFLHRMQSIELKVLVPAHDLVTATYV